MRVVPIILAFLASAVPALAQDAEGGAIPPDYTGHPIGWVALIALIVAYSVVVWGEKHELRKSIPVLIGTGVIWMLVAMVYLDQDDPAKIELMKAGFNHSIVEIGQLTFFLITAMTYVVTMQERNVFETVRYKLLHAGLSPRSIFWATGAAAFVLSPFLDNLTTALALVSVVLAVGNATGDRDFVALAAINLVVAANAGGAFSPFGDITTLMVWQAEKVDFLEFYSIFIPSLINWVVPAFIMSLAIHKSRVEAANEPVTMKRGAVPMILLFAVTMMMAVLAHMLLELPPVIGMTTGLGLLLLYGFFLHRHEHHDYSEPELPDGLADTQIQAITSQFKPRHRPFDPMISIKNLEWDTLLFFFGILTAVAGIAQLGFLVKVSALMYGGLGATLTNSLVGVLSAIVDNIPVMSAVLKMDPNMVHGQWMLVTLTAGVGGSLLSIGSAAGVALMGAAKMPNAQGRLVSVYTFMSHLRWSWAVLVGYLLSIFVHTLLHVMS
jgi:Na+/H+ antiporter NhaD/arsenite permease-like protein